VEATAPLTLQHLAKDTIPTLAAAQPGNGAAALQDLQVGDQKADQPPQQQQQQRRRLRKAAGATLAAQVVAVEEAAAVAIGAARAAATTATTNQEAPTTTTMTTCRCRRQAVRQLWRSNGNCNFCTGNNCLLDWKLRLSTKSAARFEFACTLICVHTLLLLL
jgi:hypothetical protein